MTHYKLHGVCLDSALAFPGLAETAGEPDVHLRIEPFEVEPSEEKPAVGPLRNWSRATPDDALLVWEGFAKVRIQGGREILVDPAPEAPLHLLRATLLGQVFSLLLLQRGLYPLHASSVVARGRAIAFAGPSGAGKSSLAATAVANGYTFVADDVTAVRSGGTRPEIFPGVPCFKLTPESLAALGESHDELARVGPEEEKRSLPVPVFSSDGPLPLERIYSICDGPEVRIEPLSPQQGFLEVSRNCHRPELMIPALGRAGFMDRCAELARGVPVYRLSRPRALERLGQLVQRVEEHISS